VYAWYRTNIAVNSLIISFVCSFFFFLSCDQLWLQPEIEELRTAFKKLKNLSVCGIFVEFDILWMTAFLVAAPSIEKLRIQVIYLSVFLSFSPNLEL
jgi:hypothetical protein